MKLILPFLVLLTLYSFAADEKHCYIQVTPGFRDSFEGYRLGCNALKMATDTAGSIFISANAVNEFPDLFRQRTGAYFHWLGTEDFPRDTTLLTH